MSWERDKIAEHVGEQDTLIVSLRENIKLLEKRTQHSIDLLSASTMAIRPATTAAEVIITLQGDNDDALDA